MPISRSMVATAVSLVAMMGPGNTKQPSENWIPTWGRTAGRQRGPTGAVTLRSRSGFSLGE
jgi:hypothetical protein